MTSTLRLALAVPLLVLPALVSCGDSDSGSGGPSASSAWSGGLVIRNPGSEDRDYFHDFGTVPAGEVVSRVWEIENTDPVPVTVRDLSASCSCTSSSISYVHESGELVKGSRLEKPVITLPPGAIARLEMRIDTQHVQVKNTDKLAMIVVRSDSKVTPFLRLEAHLVAKQAYQAAPSLIDLGDVPISSGARKHSDLITGIRGQAYAILGVESKSEGLEVGIEEILQGGERLWRVTAVLVPPLEPGLWEGEILLRSTKEDGTGEDTPFRLPVRGFIVPDVLVFPRALSFTDFDSEVGARADGELTALAPGHRVKVVDSLIQGAVPDGLVTSFEPIDPDAEGRSPRWRVSVVAPANLQESFFSGSLQLTLADPSQAPVQVNLVYRRPE